MWKDVELKLSVKFKSENVAGSTLILAFKQEYVTIHGKEVSLKSSKRNQKVLGKLRSDWNYWSK